jgi:hypothetical protein
LHRVIPQSQGQNLEIKFSKNSTDNLLRLYNNSILRSSRHNNSIMMQSIQQFILVCNSNNLSNNIHDGQSARGPALPLCSLALPSRFLALPSHFLALPCISSRSPCTPFTFPHAPLTFPCAHRAPSHSLARSLALPRTPPHTPPTLPCTDPALPSTSSHAPILRPNCTLSPCTFVGRRVRVKAGGGEGDDRLRRSEGRRAKGEGGKRVYVANIRTRT